MHFLNTVPIAVVLGLLPFVPVKAQAPGDNNTSNTFVQELSTFLNESGYTSLSSALVQANQSQEGQEWFSKVASDGNWTLFAPTNEAFTSAPDFVSSDLSEYLSYHFVFGNLRNTTASGSEGGGGVGGGGGQTPSSSQSSTTSSASETSSAAGDGGASSGSSSSLTSSTSESSRTSSISGGNTAPTQLPVERVRVKRQQPQQSQSGIQLLSGVYPNVTIGRTLLNDSQWVYLEGNKTQALAWTRSGDDGNVTILNQIQNVTVSNATQWRNVFIAEVDGVLIPPGGISTALRAINDTTLLSVAQEIQVPPSGSAVSLLDEARGFTLFAPSSSAFTSEVNSTLEGLQSNQTALLSLLQNHYVNGSTLYSPTLQEVAVNSSSSSGSSNHTTVYSAGGEPFTFNYNATGLFVSNGNGTSARVIRPDVLVRNGVIHVVDNVLFNTESDPAAANIAYESASASAQTATVTEALGTAPIATSTSAEGGSGGGSGSPSTMTESGSSTSTGSAEPSTQSQSESGTAGGGSGSPSTATASATPSSFRVRRALRV